MAELIKEERFIYFIATEEHVLRVQELIGGSSVWPDSYRICVPAGPARGMRANSTEELLERSSKRLPNTYHRHICQCKGRAKTAPRPFLNSEKGPYTGSSGKMTNAELLRPPR